MQTSGAGRSSPIPELSAPELIPGKEERQELELSWSATSLFNAPDDACSPGHGWLGREHSQNPALLLIPKLLLQTCPCMFEFEKKKKIKKKDQGCAQGLGPRCSVHPSQALGVISSTMTIRETPKKSMHSSICLFGSRFLCNHTKPSRAAPTPRTSQRN